jgi:MerR family redox-sensitive transcriptional activator SoxR
MKSPAATPVTLLVFGNPARRLCDKLAGCIGCGCLSMGVCKLFNPNDSAAERGPGARYVIDD